MVQLNDKRINCKTKTNDNRFYNNFTIDFHIHTHISAQWLFDVFAFFMTAPSNMSTNSTQRSTVKIVSCPFRRIVKRWWSGIIDLQGKLFLAISFQRDDKLTFVINTVVSVDFCFSKKIVNILRNRKSWAIWAEESNCVEFFDCHKMHCDLSECGRTKQERTKLQRTELTAEFSQLTVATDFMSFNVGLER